MGLQREFCLPKGPPPKGPPSSSPPSAPPYLQPPPAIETVKNAAGPAAGHPSSPAQVQEITESVGSKTADASNMNRPVKKIEATSATTMASSLVDVEVGGEAKESDLAPISLSAEQWTKNRRGSKSKKTARKSSKKKSADLVEKSTTRAVGQDEDNEITYVDIKSRNSQGGRGTSADADTTVLPNKAAKEDEEELERSGSFATTTHYTLQSLSLGFDLDTLDIDLNAPHTLADKFCRNGSKAKRVRNALSGEDDRNLIAAEENPTEEGERGLRTDVADGKCGQSERDCGGNVKKESVPEQVQATPRLELPLPYTTRSFPESNELQNVACYENYHPDAVLPWSYTSMAATSSTANNHIVNTSSRERDVVFSSTSTSAVLSDHTTTTGNNKTGNNLQISGPSSSISTSARHSQKSQSSTASMLMFEEQEAAHENLRNHSQPTGCTSQNTRNCSGGSTQQQHQRSDGGPLQHAYDLLPNYNKYNSNPGGSCTTGGPATSFSRTGSSSGADFEDTVRTLWKWQQQVSKFSLETLFYVFYQLVDDIMQAYAAEELYNRGWKYHVERERWFFKRKTVKNSVVRNDFRDEDSAMVHDDQNQQYPYNQMQEHQRTFAASACSSSFSSATSWEIHHCAQQHQTNQQQQMRRGFGSASQPLNVSYSSSSFGSAVAKEQQEWEWITWDYLNWCEQKVLVYEKYVERFVNYSGEEDENENSATTTALHPPGVDRKLANQEQNPTSSSRSTTTSRKDKPHQATHFYVIPNTMQEFVREFLPAEATRVGAVV
ncbi:unnamed protein product [Amoebophrya sp. A120]|nr:unnamed protein product [Amoebophrya sp. A120]|eukprot:GSA120T00021355001.1